MVSTDSKKKFIEAWNSHIDDFNILALCEKETDRKAVQGAQAVLKEAVKKIAETKKFSKE